MFQSKAFGFTTKGLPTIKKIERELERYHLLAKRVELRINAIIIITDKLVRNINRL